MTKIVLCCANGFTTTMLCKKAEEEAERQGLDYNIKAYPMTEIDTVANGAAVILLGPQVRYNLQKVKKAYPNIPVLMIENRTLAFTDGAALVEQIKAALEK